MRIRIHYSLFNLFILLSGLLCLFYIIVFHPVTYQAQGDFPAYLGLARQIFDLPGAPTVDLSHRSPLYSVIIGLFILIFGEPEYLPMMMALHYILIFLTSIIVYSLFILVTGNGKIAFAAGIAGVVNLTTVFFGYIMISEITGLFLFTATTWLLISGYLKRKYSLLALAGITSGLLILTRYNTLGIPLVFIIAVTGIHIINNGFKEVKKLLSCIAVFIIPALIVLNIWSVYNYRENGFYGLIPEHHTGQRWSVPATISCDDIVGDEYKDVLGIFLRTKEKLLNEVKDNPARKGSLLSNKTVRKMNDFFRPGVSGYFMYRDSEAELLKYYGLEYSPENIRLLNQKLKPFYKSIAGQNKKELKRFRLYSFLYSFKHVSPTLPTDSPMSLNILPAFILRLYKLAFIFMTVAVFVTSFFHSLYISVSHERLKAGSFRIVIYMLIWYFPASNWYASVLGDANRFRFPADSVIIGIFICYCAFLLQRIKVISMGRPFPDTGNVLNH